MLPARRQEAGAGLSDAIEPTATVPTVCRSPGRSRRREPSRQRTPWVANCWRGQQRDGRRRECATKPSRASPTGRRSMAPRLDRPARRHAGAHGARPRGLAQLVARAGPADHRPNEQAGAGRKKGQMSPRVRSHLGPHGSGGTGGAAWPEQHRHSHGSIGSQTVTAVVLRWIERPMRHPAIEGSFTGRSQPLPRLRGL